MSEESKEWVADPRNWNCDAPGATREEDIFRLIEGADLQHRFRLPRFQDKILQELDICRMFLRGPARMMFVSGTCWD